MSRHTASLKLALVAASAALTPVRALAGDGFAKPPPPAAPPAGAERAPIRLDDARSVLAPVSHGNLTLFPVITTAKAIPKADFLVLDEGMARHLVRVVEKDGGDVNQLTLRNDADRPLFLMAGEVVIGGRQDRIIGKNTIVTARTTEDVPVFCVEHGRWSGRKADFESAQVLAHTELRKQASFGNQQGVWDEVAAKNATRKVANDTGTYRDVARGKGGVRESIASYQKDIGGALARGPQRDRQIGFVVAVGGEVVAIETFSSPTLFRKFEGKLLRSYYVEAIDRGDPKRAAPPPAAAAVTGFAAKAKEAKRAVVVDKPTSKTVQFDQADLKGSEVEAADGAKVYSGAYK